MSDVSKTNELIAEAQEHYSEMNGLSSRAAEVMMELVAALEAKTGVRVDMSSATRVPVQGEPNDELIAEARTAAPGDDPTELAVKVHRLADALESATRVPEQGEASVAIERVRAIHKREVIAVHPGVGEEAWCPACQEHWPCSTVAALDGAPEPEAGTKVVIGKQNRGDDDESWTFTEWEPFELEKAREEFPNSVYEVVTVFGLPVEGESDD